VRARSDLPTGTVTFPFTDIEGSTRLVQALGDGYPPLLEQHHDIVRSAIEANDGLVVSTEGDSFFAVFPAAPAALSAAVEAQLALARHAWPESAAIRVRMGVHTGEGRIGAGSY
jgi:class 3 adenylate cyclase